MRWGEGEVDWDVVLSSAVRALPTHNQRVQQRSECVSRNPRGQKGEMNGQRERDRHRSVTTWLRHGEGCELIAKTASLT